MIWYAWYASTPVLDPYTKPEVQLDGVNGLNLQFFEFTGGDGTLIEGCVVTRKEIPGSMTPRLSRIRDLLNTRGNLLTLDSQAGVVLVSTTWDHGIENSMNYAESLAGAGYTCVLWNPRGKGAGRREYCSYGYYEAADVPLLLDALKEVVGDTAPVAAVGQGFGASLLMLAASREPRIRCMVSMDSFCILKSALMRAMEADWGGTAGYVPFWLMEFGMRVRAGYSSYEVVPVDAARSLTIPAMLVCTDELFFSDLQDTLTMYAAVPGPDKIVFHGRMNHEPYGTKVREHVEIVEGRHGEKIEEHYQIHLYDGEDDLMAFVAEWIQDNNRLSKPKVLPGELPGMACKQY